MSNYLKSKRRIMKGKRDIESEISTFHNTNFSLCEMFELFMKVKETEGLSVFTIRDYHVHFQYFIEFVKKDLPKNEINLEIFNEYIRYLLHDKGLSPVTVNVRLRTLKAFIRYCYSEGYIDIALHEKIKLIKTPNDTIQALTEVEVKLLLTNISDQYYAGFRDKVIVLTLLDTMVRISELLSIKRSNVDLKTGMIYLNATETKTKRARTVPISVKTVKILTQYIKETDVFQNDTLFLTYDGRQLDSNTVRKNLSKYALSANINSKRVSPHTFRHTGALLYILNGGDPFSLQKILGHSDMSMVRKYIQMSNTDIKNQHNFHSPLKNIF